MHNFNRRRFFQFTGSALTVLGLSQLKIRNQGLRYAKAIASPGNRKLALLVGINNYQNVTNLQGAITDVYLQKELLVHRFGFNPQDVLLVSDESDIKPTREGILQAFEEHLINQAKPGDTVVYHFSGHGSQVSETESSLDNNLNSTFVPSDRLIEQAGQQSTVSDITGKTLFLLMSAIKTDNLTVVLDSCYSGGGKRGNLTVRSIEGGEDYLPSSLEQEYQQKWLSKLKLSSQELEQRRKNSIAKGVVIASARENQIAAEAYLDGFVTGAFTYLMTQYLWQENNPGQIDNIIANVSRSINNSFSSNQKPEFEVLAGSGNDAQPIYFSDRSVPPAEAVITQVNGNSVDFWLGGVSPQALAAFNRDAVFQLVDNKGVEQGKIQLQSRNALSCRGQVLEIARPELLKPGAFLQERIRVIPADYKLHIGLDDSLGNDIEVAKSEIAKSDRIEPIELQTDIVHYILGRITQDRQTELQNQQVTNIPSLNSLGLFTEGLDLVPGSFDSADEAIKDALTRLQPKFRSLLAERIIKLTLNADSSRLGVAASLNILGANETVAAQTIPSRSIAKEDQLSTLPNNINSINYENGIPQIPLNTLVQLQIQNKEAEALYITVLIVNPEGAIDVIFPNTWSAAENATLVKAGETLAIPKASDPWQITVQEPLGLSEVLVVASKSPLRKSLQSLQTIAQQEARGDLPVSIGNNSTEIVNLLLEDISSDNRENISRNNSVSSTTTSKEKVHPSDTTQIAAMSISYVAVK
jgi:hypothetical protein